MRAQERALRPRESAYTNDEAQRITSQSHTRSDTRQECREGDVTRALNTFCSVKRSWEGLRTQLAFIPVAKQPTVNSALLSSQETNAKKGGSRGLHNLYTIPSEAQYLHSGIPAKRPPLCIVQSKLIRYRSDYRSRRRAVKLDTIDQSLHAVSRACAFLHPKFPALVAPAYSQVGTILFLTSAWPRPHATPCLSLSSDQPFHITPPIQHFQTLLDQISQLLAFNILLLNQHHPFRNHELEIINLY